MKGLRFFLPFLLILLILFSLSDSIYAQGKTIRATNLYVNRGIDGRGGIPFWWNGFIYGNYAGDAYDVFRWDYTGSGHYILNLLADGSPVLTLTKAGILWASGGISGAVSLPDSDASNYLSLGWAENDTSDRDLDFKVVGASRIITLSGSPTLGDWFNQSVKTTDSPTYVTTTLSGSTASRLLSTNGSKTLVSTDLFSWVTGTANQVIIADDADGTITFSGPQDLAAASSPGFTGLSLSGLTASRLLASDGSKNLVSSDLFGWIAGTTNRVTLGDDGDGTVTFTTPQDTHSGANPTFAGANLDAINVGITASGEIDTDSGNLTLDSNAGQVSIDDNFDVTGNAGFGDSTPIEGRVVVDPSTITGIAFTGTIDQDNQKAVTYTVSADTDADNTWGIHQTVNTGTGTLSDSGGIILREAIGIQSDVTVAVDESPVDYDYARAVGIWNDISVSGKQGWGVGVYNNISDLSGGEYAQVSGVYNAATTGVTVSATNYMYTMKNYINPDGLTNGGAIYGLVNQLYGMGIDTGTAYIYGTSNDIIASLYDTGDGVVEAYSFTSGIRMEAGDIGYHIYIEDGDLSTGGTEYGVWIDLDDTDVTNYSIYVADGSAGSYFGSDTGFGITSPGGIIHTAKSAADGVHFLDSYSSTDTDKAYILFRKSSSTTIGTWAETIDDHWLGMVGFRGTNSSSANNYGASIKAQQDGAAGGTYIPTDLIFETYSNSAANTNQFTLFSDGNIGIMAGAYLNWGATHGTSGYGIWDDSGTLKWKNSGGGWAIFGASLWTEAGGNLSPTTTTNSINIATGESYKQNSNPVLRIIEADFNTFVGKGAGDNVTVDGDYLTFVGDNAGNAHTTGDYNTYIGAQAGAAMTGSSALYCTFVGSLAGSIATQAQQGVYIGYKAGQSATGNFNVYIGNNAGAGNTNSNNVAIGRNAFDATGTATNTVAIGEEAGSSLTNPIGNVIIGNDAGKNITTGAFNVLIGNLSGDALQTSDGYNTFIGGTTDVFSSGIDSSILIGYSARAHNDHELIVGGYLSTGYVTDGYFGQGYQVANPVDFTFHATSGQGTNNVGADLIIAGGKSTGNATPGNIIFQISDPGASGSTLQTLAEKARITDTEFKIANELVLTPSTDQVIDAVGNAILANGPIVFLDPDGDYTLTSTPTIADGTKGQILRIMCNNGEANIVTVQDQDSLGGSNLEIGAASRAITGKAILTLVFDGTDWLEENFQAN